MSWAASWSVCISAGIGGEDGPALFGLGGAACYRQSLAFWCRSGVVPGLPQKRLSDGKWALGREVVPLSPPCAVVAYFMKASGEVMDYGGKIAPASSKNK